MSFPTISGDVVSCGTTRDSLAHRQQPRNLYVLETIKAGLAGSFNNATDNLLATAKRLSAFPGGGSELGVAG